MGKVNEPKVQDVWNTMHTYCKQQHSYGIGDKVCKSLEYAHKRGLGQECCFENCPLMNQYKYCLR